MTVVAVLAGGPWAAALPGPRFILYLATLKFPPLEESFCINLKTHGCFLSPTPVKCTWARTLSAPQKLSIFPCN